jgi:DNA mismatch repair protein PMS2
MKKLSEKDIIQMGSSQVILSLSQAVKELIENSLDASSTTIEIKLEDYGKRITITGIY